MFPLILILGAVAGVALAASYAKNVKPAVTRTATLTPGRVYLLIVKNDQPGAPLMPSVAFASMVSSGAFNPLVSQDGSTNEVSYVSGTLAADGSSYTFTFDWYGPDPGTFSWDSAFAIEDQGAIFAQPMPIGMP